MRRKHAPRRATVDKLLLLCAVLSILFTSYMVLPILINEAPQTPEITDTESHTNRLQEFATDPEAQRQYFLALENASE